MVRGEVFRLPDQGGRGHVQRGRRFAVVVQADELLALSTVIVAPTSTRASAASFRPQIDLGRESTRVLADQVRVVDASRLGRSAGRLSAAEIRAVDEALELVLALG